MAGILGDLFAIANVAGPLDVRVFVSGMVAFARSVDNKIPILLVGAGVPQDQLLIQNLGVSPIELGVNRGLSYGQGLRVPARSQWSPLGGVQSIWASPNYYDRNPLSLLFQSYLVNVNPHTVTSRWLYTVPANRRAFLEASETLVQLQTIGDVDDALHFAESYIFVTPVAGGGGAIAIANIQQAAAARSIMTAKLGTSMELQSGDTVQGATLNTYTATQSSHEESCKITEFDA